MSGRLRTAYRQRRRQALIRLFSAAIGAASGIVLSSWLTERLEVSGFAVGLADVQRFAGIVLMLAFAGWVIAWLILRLVDPLVEQEEDPPVM